MPVLPPIRVGIRLFAMQRVQAGTRELRLELPLGATVEDAWTAAVGAVPALAPGRRTLRFAVNGAYAEPSTPLADGDEVAAIPPVSGGSGEADDLEADMAPAPAGPADRIRVIEIRDGPFPATLPGDLTTRLATLEDGAVVAFVGMTRVTPGTPAPGQEAEAARFAGHRVDGLEYEAFEPMALGVLAAIADEIEARFDVRRLAIIHRTGAVAPGETSVLVVAAAPHRDAAFAAARYAIDETKARAPIWKAERFADGRVWIGEPARTAAEREPGDAPKASNG
jgi:molybdopterin synthase catalytic subunit